MAKWGRMAQNGGGAKWGMMERNGGEMGECHEHMMEKRIKTSQHESTMGGNWGGRGGPAHYGTTLAFPPHFSGSSRLSPQYPY